VQPTELGDGPSEPGRQSQRVALGVLMGLAFLVVAWMAAPLLVGLALGTVMGFTAQPVYQRLSRRLGQKRQLASAVTTLLGGLIMVGGGVGLLWVFVSEIANAVARVQRAIAGGAQLLVGSRVEHVLGRLGVDREAALARLHEELGRAANLAAQGAALLVQASAGALLTIVVALWTMYSVMLDWPRIEHHLERLLPLDPRHTRALVDEFRKVGRRAFVATLACAVLQGGVAAIGFSLFGVPQPVAWGALLALLSFIPVVGTLLVWVPAAVWLLTTGHPVRAVMLVAWCLVLVMAANDYFVRPRLVGHGEEAHPLLTLVALLGGISVFGAAGVIVGPVVMALFVASARIYERERDADVEARAVHMHGGCDRNGASAEAPAGEHSAMKKLSGMRVAILVCEGFEQVELTDPQLALEDEGAHTFVVSPLHDRVRAWKAHDWGKRIRVDVDLHYADPSAYDALLLPGGVMNPDRLRLHPEAIDFIRAFAEAKKPIAAICHGPWTLIDAGCVRGKTMTSWPSLRADLTNAGASWVDEEVVRDGMLVTSRKPADIPAFNRRMIEMFAEVAPPAEQAIPAEAGPQATQVHGM
jgi:protease I